MPVSDDLLSLAAQVRVDMGLSSGSQLDRLFGFLLTCTKDERKVTTAQIAIELFADRRSTPRARVLLYKLRARLEYFYSRYPPAAGGRLRIDKGTNWITARDSSQRPDTWDSVSAAEFARLVIAICELKGITREERARRFREWIDRPHEGAIWGAASVKKPSDFDQFFETLNERIPVSHSDFRDLAGVFEIPSLLLDPLLSQIARGQRLLALNLHDDFVNAMTAAAGQTGFRSTYYIAKRRLPASDAAFVRVRLDPGGYSSDHEHPGDELLLVLDGRVEIRFGVSGVSTQLKAGDFIHFYAEQRHIVENHDRNSAAELFIVRFYQLAHQGTRQAILRAIEADLRQKKPLSCEAEGWLRQMLPIYRVTTTNEIRDRLALARFLERWNDRPQAIPVSEQRARAKELGITTEQLDLIESGENPGTNLALRAVAHIYDADQFLLANFRYPAVHGAVVVRGGDGPTGLENQVGGVARVALDGENDRLSYYVPTSNLSCSDISMSRVVVPPGGSTGFNAHPGFECVLLVNGSVEVWYEDEPQPQCVLELSGRRLAHYDSQHLHKVMNRSDHSDATFWVIRFLRDGSS